MWVEWSQAEKTDVNGKPLPGEGGYVFLMRFLEDGNIDDFYVGDRAEAIALRDELTKFIQRMDRYPMAGWR